MSKAIDYKTETHLDFKPLGNHYHIERNINSNKQKSQKDKRVVSASPSYYHGIPQQALLKTKEH